MLRLKKFCCLALAACVLSLGLAQGVCAADLYVSGAASLTNAFDAIKTAFEKKNPGIKVLTNYAASNPLLKQMQEGAPVDVFASADQQTMDKAQQGKLIDPATRRNFALNDLVLIVPADSKVAVKGVESLTSKDVKRIAIGNPDSVPAGRYTRDALTTARLWETLQPKYINSSSVRQALDYVARGEVDAGFVYRTDALKAGKKVKIVANVLGHEPVSYPIAVAKTGKNPSDGAKFVDFVLSPEGMAILARFGFSRP